MKIKPGQEEARAKYVELNSHDPYSAAVIRYEEQWASAMEEQIEAGKPVSDAAAATQFTADTKGITGFMYGCAVSALSAHWLHGEELRRWHNVKVQIGDEGERANESGGVLNPALMSISTK